MRSRQILSSTPFHNVTAEHTNPDAWIPRGRFMVPAYYTALEEEALAPHLSASLSDFSFVERVRLFGPGAVRMLSLAFGWAVDALTPGSSRPVMWRNEKGAVRGIGTLVRSGESEFLILAHAADAHWFMRAARRFDARVRDDTGERGVLLLMGPYAFAVLAAAGFEGAARLEPGRHGEFHRMGANVTVGRWDPMGGFAILTPAAEAGTVFDMIAQGGRLFGMRLVGQEALETRLLEAALLVPGIDFEPARADAATTPSPQSLLPGPGLVRSDGDRRIPADGRFEVLARPDGEDVADASNDGFVLAGVEIDGETPAAFAPIVHDGAIIGHTLRSAYSPLLRRAIALAQVRVRYAAVDAPIMVRTLSPSGTVDMPARIAALPFILPSAGVEQP